MDRGLPKMLDGVGCLCVIVLVVPRELGWGIMYEDIRDTVDPIMI